MNQRSDPAAPAPSSSRRRRTVVLAGVAGVGVLVAGGIGLSLLRDGDGGGSSGAAAAEEAGPTTTTTTPLASDAGSYALAYLSTDAKQTTVFLTDGKGAKTSVLARLPGQAEALQWSPDGKRLLLDGDGAGSDFALSVVAADGGAVTPLAPSATSGEGGAAWSPDGSQVVFFSNRDGDFAGYVVSVAGGDARRVTPVDLPAVTDLSFSPDGRTIAFATSSGVDSAVWTVAADGSDARRASDLVGATNPVWSPDGKHLAVSAQPVGEASADIYLVDVATGTSKRLAATKYLDAFPVWAPDGEHVYFSSSVPNDDADGGNADDLLRVAVAGGTPEPVTSDPISIESELAPSDDGHLIAFSVRRQGDKEVFVANADGSGAIPVSRSPRLDAFAAWKPGTGPRS